MLSFMLSSFRERKLKSLGAPALMPEATLKAHGMTPLQSRFHFRAESDALIWSNVIEEAQYQTNGCLRCKFSQEALDPLRFNKAEADLIRDPCPLIFAVATQTFGTETNASYDLENPLNIEHNPNPNPNDRNRICVMKVDRAVLLGRDIKWIYAPGPDVFRVQQALGSLNGQVQVLDFSRIPYHDLVVTLPQQPDLHPDSSGSKLESSALEPNLVATLPPQPDLRPCISGRDLEIPAREAELFGNSWTRRRYESQGQWLLGTQSPMLSFMLSTFREPQLNALEAPALMSGETLNAYGITPLQSQFYSCARPGMLIWLNVIEEAEHQTDGCSRCKFSQKALTHLQFNEAEADLITNPCPLIFAVETQTFSAVL